MLPQLQKQLKTAIVFLAGVGVHHYSGRALDYKNNQQEMLEQAARDHKIDNIETMVKSLHETASNVKKSPVQSGSTLDAESVKANLEGIKDCCSNMSNVSGSDYMSTEAQTKLAEYSNRIDSYVEEIRKLIENSGNTNFNSWLTQYYDFLNSLSLHQESAFINILLFLLLMLTILNILAIFFGNEIIKYFNLESKFPSLASFFKLRTKFQKYYLLWNIFIFFVVCFIGIFINIIIFI